jgi:hypothetical protein
MALQAKASDSAEFKPTRTAVGEREQLLHSVGEQEIRDRAYEIYLQRGAQPGSELDDWLEAERELGTKSST